MSICITDGKYICACNFGADNVILVFVLRLVLKGGRFSSEDHANTSYSRDASPVTSKESRN